MTEISVVTQWYWVPASDRFSSPKETAKLSFDRTLGELAMHTRFKIAAVALAVSGILIVAWRGLANQKAADGDCNFADPLSSCSDAPKLGIAASELVVTEPELASARGNDGTLAVIRFAPQALAADITEFLDAYSITMVDGPKSGGMYTVRLPQAGRTKNDLIRRLQIETAIVDFIAGVQ
jgi:hypothetical protein